MDVRMAMTGALMGIGMRSKRLNKAAIQVGKRIGPLHFDPTGKCDPFDVVKNLTNPLVRKRLGL